MDAMTLDEAIEHAEERATACDDECGQEHEQLAEWLRELRDIRKVWNNLITAYDDVCKRYNDSDARHIYTINYLYDKVARVEGENEKLRELVRDMWRFTGEACKKYPRLFDPAAQGGQMVKLNMIDAFEQRMRELGIEVE